MVHITECMYLQNFWLSSHNAKDIEMWVQALDYRAQRQKLCRSMTCVVRYLRFFRYFFLVFCHQKEYEEELNNCSVGIL